MSFPDWHFTEVAIISLLLGVVLGFLMFRSDFCMAGAFRDLFLFRSLSRLRPLLLLVAAGALFFEGARLAGLFSTYPFPFFAPPSLTNVFGGFLFGIGMVLAGGCVVGVLYKMGGGSFPAFLAFLGLLAGSALYAEIHPYWKKAATVLSFPTTAITLPQLTHTPQSLWVLMLCTALLIPFESWRRKGLWIRPSHVEGYVQPWVSALVFAFAGLLSAIFVGMPFGVTTSYAKAAAWIESLAFKEHVAALEFFSATPLKYTPPFSDHLLYGGGGANLDAVALIQVPLIVGIVAGAAFSSCRLGEFHLSFRMPRTQVVSTIAGGTLMGLASRMTPGCNIWHIWGGIPIFAIQSILFLVGILPGAWVGTQLLKSFVFREGQTSQKVST